MPTLRLVAESTCAERQVGPWDLDALRAWFDDPAPLASLDQAGAAALLRDLAFALRELCAGSRQRAVVPTEAAAPSSTQRLRKGAVWELGLERDADRLLVSLFRQGTDPEVSQVERGLRLDQARDDVLEAIGDFPVADRGLALAREALLAVGPLGGARGKSAWRKRVHIESTRRSKLVLRADVELRRPMQAAPSEVARADLHALLFLGDLTLEVGSSHRTLRRVHVFLVAELLAQLAREALEAQAGRRGMLRRVSVAGTRCGVLLDADGDVAVTLEHGEQMLRMAAVSCTDFARSVVSFCRRLAKQVMVADRGQKSNLRLTTFRREVRGLVERLRGSSDLTSQLNGSPESYRAFAETDSRKPPSVAPRAHSAGKLRFTESWRADVPGIDLRSMFLVGDRLIVAASREVACIERTTGHLLWTRPSHRSISIMTPVGLARLAADGRLALHDPSDGEPLFQVQLGPCVGASASGAVVNASGLPHMLLVGEGTRHLVAVDLDSSEIRWRRAVRSRSEGAARRPLRLRRAGKLMLVTGGEAQLLAVDLLTGEVVWRRAGRHRYAAVSVDRGEVYAFSSEVYGRRSRSMVERLDPWTGEVAWSATLPRPVSPLGPPRVADGAVLIVTRDDDRDGARTGVIGLDRETGEIRYDLRGGLCDGQGGCVVVDGVLLANSESGELVALDTEDGTTRYRHVFAGWSTRFHPADRPRSVQPVLRSGALFLPQTEVYVVRPSDGAMLGRVPGELIPDALRVDERCGVYIAEASGYVAAYHALPTLSVVKAR